MGELLLERETLLRQQIERAAARLADIAEQIAKDGYSVQGSEGQPVPNRLIRVEQDVQRGQREAYRELQDVTRQLESVRQLEAANAIMRRSA